jgi:hypothetical protein
VVDEVEVGYADSAWCCVIPNAPDSDTTFTHVPITLNNINNEHEETSSATSVNTCEVNANSDINHVPETILANGGLSYVLTWMLTIRSYLLNSALLGLVGPEVCAEESTIKYIKYQGEMFWRSIVIPLFFISTLFWDTLSYFTDSTDKDKNRPRVCRDVMRKCDKRIKHIRPSHAALYFFPAMWLIFAGSINVSQAAYQGLAPVHPFELASARITTTHERITYLDKLVDLSPGTFAQYQKFKTNKWLSETFPKKKEMKPHCPDDYFDTYEEFPVKTGQ